MAHGSKAFKFSAAFAAFSLVLSSSAHAAPAAMGSIDPLVSLSVFGTSASRTAVCAAGAAAGAAATAATAATIAQPGPGCVLPVVGAGPPPLVQTPAAVTPVAVGSGIGLGGLLPLFAILGLGALAVFLLERRDDAGPPPISPF